MGSTVATISASGIGCLVLSHTFFLTIPDLDQVCIGCGCGGGCCGVGTEVEEVGLMGSNAGEVKPVGWIGRGTSDGRVGERDRELGGMAIGGDGAG